MNLTEAREQYRIVREKLLEAKTTLLNVSKRIAKAQKTLLGHEDAYALAIKTRAEARAALREAAAKIPSSLAEDLQHLCSLSLNAFGPAEGAWQRFEEAREALLRANSAVSEIEHAKSEAEETLKSSEAERAEAHAEFLKWQKNAIQAAAVVERFLSVELAGMAPQTQSQEAAPEIDPEIAPAALSGPEPESCQNPQ